MTDSLITLRFAVAATRHGGGGIRLATRVRRSGLDGFDEILRGLSQDQADAVEENVERLANQNVSALLLGEATIQLRWRPTVRRHRCCSSSGLVSCCGNLGSVRVARDMLLK